MPLLKKTLSLMDEQVAVSKVAAASYQEVFELSKPVKVIHNIIQEDLIKQNTMWRLMKLVRHFLNKKL